MINNLPLTNMSDCAHYLEHVMISPDNSRFAFKVFNLHKEYLISNYMKIQINLSSKWVTILLTHVHFGFQIQLIILCHFNKLISQK